METSAYWNSVRNNNHGRVIKTGNTDVFPVFFCIWEKWNDMSAARYGKLPSIRQTLTMRIVAEYENAAVA